MTAIHPPVFEERRQPAWVMLLHWVTVALLVIGVAAVVTRDFVDDRGLRTVLLTLHRAAGLAVFAVTVLRIATSPWIRLKDPSLPGAMRWGSAISHLLLYAVLLLNPVLGWALTSAQGQTAYFLGAIPLPSLVTRDRDLADQLQDIHFYVALVLLSIIAAHSAAALWHHYVRRDHVLRRMLPGRRRAESNHAIKNPGNSNHEI